MITFSYYNFFLAFFITQVLSEKVAKALKLTGGSDAEETATFCDMFDKFFDVLNVSNYTEGVRHQKVFKLPYTHPDDFRLKVGYFKYLMNTCNA